MLLVWNQRVYNSKLKPTYTAFLTVCYYHVTYKFQSESIHIVLPECQETPCWKQAPYLKFKLQQCDLNPQPLSSKMTTQPFSQTGQNYELSDKNCKHI